MQTEAYYALFGQELKSGKQELKVKTEKKTKRVNPISKKGSRTKATKPAKKGKYMYYSEALRQRIYTDDVSNLPSELVSIQTQLGWNTENACAWCTSEDYRPSHRCQPCEICKKFAHAADALTGFHDQRAWENKTDFNRMYNPEDQDRSTLLWICNSCFYKTCRENREYKARECDGGYTVEVSKDLPHLLAQPYPCVCCGKSDIQNHLMWEGNRIRIECDTCFASLNN